jgi:hypothetical protein
MKNAEIDWDHTSEILDIVNVGLEYHVIESEYAYFNMLVS